MRLPILTFCSAGMLAAVLATATVAGCARESAPAVAPQPAAAPETPAVKTAPAESDEQSYAEPDKVRTTDLALDLALDFDRKSITGVATYTLEWVDPAGTHLVLDTRDLTLSQVEGAG
jgi:hypothetical protein